MSEKQSSQKVGLAFDRGSARAYDTEGRLRVAGCNISKANVCPYAGREIPDFEALGLDPDRTYRLYRDPEELAKAAPTFAGVPLLSRHVPVTADDHQPDLVVGSIGTDVEFVAPYLRASLIVWAADAIRAIEAETKAELSSAYRYTADMMPGTADGEAYDGCMRGIIGNHVALVSEGRAGSDVVVGDSKHPEANQESEDMASTAKSLSRAALFASGAIRAYLRPKLAQDAKVDFAPALAGVTAKNFAAKRPAIVAAVTERVKGKLAQDADIEDLAALLDALDPVEMADGTDADMPGVTTPPADNPGAMDDDKLVKLKAFLKGKISDEDMAQLDALMGAGPDNGAADEPPPSLPKPGTENNATVTKPAMDAAIAAAVKVATDRATGVQREIRDAERAVRPYVGDLAMAHDSAESVYRSALQMLGVKVEGVHPSAFPVILSMQATPGAAKKHPVAMDAAGAKTFAERFPDAARITSV